MSAPREEGVHRLVVDRREGDLVVVELDGGGTVDLPAWLLPPSTREGDVVLAEAGPAGDGWRVELRVDPDETRRARDAVAERLERLRARDPGGDIEL